MGVKTESRFSTLRRPSRRLQTQWEWHMKSKPSLFTAALLVACLTLWWAVSASAQTPGQGSEEKKLGGYVVTQSVELGYRITSLSSAAMQACPPGSDFRNSSGNCADPAMFNTFVNLQTGPRLLEQTLSMRAPVGTGVLFDNLFVNSFGWGGDPNNLARATVWKEKFYNLNLIFRRDQNAFDYNLLANPLTSGVVPAQFAVNDSPHSFAAVRRMWDVNLKLMPASIISPRFGYSRNRYEGPSLNTLHQATDTIVLQNLNTTMDTYDLGFDLRVLPRTTISYDHIMSWFKGDTWMNDQNFTAVLTSGTPADLGIIYTAGSTPCTGINPASPLDTSAMTKTKYCNLYTTYTRANPYRTNSHTDQISIQSNYFERLDLSLRGAYTNSDMTGMLTDLFQGMQQRTMTLQSTSAEPLASNVIRGSMDAAATLQITKKLRLSNTFRWSNWRSPTSGNLIGASIVCNSNTDCVHTKAGSPSNNLYLNLLQEKRKDNQVELEYDFTPKLGARIGYRFTNRWIRGYTSTLNVLTSALTQGDESTEINEHVALLGAWWRPSRSFRANLDVESGTADNFEFRTGPRRILQYRMRASYQPARWATLSASGNFQELRNNVAEVQYNAHHRGMGFNVFLTPNNKFTFDMGYVYANTASNSLVCFATSGGIPIAPGCAIMGAGWSETNQIYGDKSHSFNAFAQWKPWRRLTTTVGYTVATSEGNFTRYYLLQPYGALNSTFHRPLAAVEVGLGKGISAKGAWNYYGYGESDVAGPTLPRDFNAHLTTLSLKYTF